MDFPPSIDGEAAWECIAHAAGDSDKRKLEWRLGLEIFHTNFLYAYTRF